MKCSKGNSQENKKDETIGKEITETYKINREFWTTVQKLEGNKGKKGIKSLKVKMNKYKPSHTHTHTQCIRDMERIFYLVIPHTTPRRNHKQRRKNRRLNRNHERKKERAI